MNGSEGAQSLMHSQSTVDQPSDKLGEGVYQKESKSKRNVIDQTEMILQNQKTKLKRNKICINKKVRKTWTAQEDQQLQRSIQQYGSNWVQIAASMVNRNPSQCTQRWKRIKPQALRKRKPFSVEEDQLILQLVTKYRQNWGKIAQMFPERTNKQIRERYINKLNPLNKQEPFTEEEDQIILKAYQEIGSKWTKIQDLLVGRPVSIFADYQENMIKNRFYSYLRQRFLNIKNPYYSIPSKTENLSINQNLKVEKDEKQLKEPQVQPIKKEHNNQRNTDIQEMSTQLPLLQSDPYSQIPQPLFLGNFSYPQYYLYQPGAIVYTQCLQVPYTGFQNKIYLVQQDTNQLMHWSNT
ncbi:unnamed protein product (macronuclear) [Paramecium tetraurelia]|uniref:Uncharacterized protein n=1 Tax=Paramecium tetraurelia TaxID=5888 RepID=A0BNZ5_PARTE|nr:uncharacterized protein GSPATT00030901001 [Paramecium tetraurelia]CAK60262.1 unnamed protein product [Paramecium tetraurelia]|eukprot:XP_001427660.1 hypothetical protein (macronuclear) [Paramecium tetraurelia strain d4-2]